LTPQQCSAVAGTGAKAIPATPIWTNLDTSVSDTLVRATDAVSYTTDAGVKNKMVVFEIDPAALDVAGGFDCIRCNTGASKLRTSRRSRPTCSRCDRTRRPRLPRAWTRASGWR
jgi:hypothetical protein